MLKTQKSERKVMAQVTPTETDGVVIAEVDMGDTSGLTVRAAVIQASTIFYDTPATLGLSHFLCYPSVLACVLWFLLVWVLDKRCLDVFFESNYAILSGVRWPAVINRM